VKKVKHQRETYVERNRGTAMKSYVLFIITFSILMYLFHVLSGYLLTVAYMAEWVNPALGTAYYPFIQLVTGVLAATVAYGLIQVRNGKKEVTS